MSGKPDRALRQAPREIRLAGNDEVYSLGAFAFLVGLDIEGDALPFRKRFEPGPLDGGDVHEHVAAAIIGLDEAVTTLCIEELNDTCHCHWVAPNPKAAAGPHGATARPDIHMRGRASAVLGPQSLRQPPSEAERQSQQHNVNLNARCGKVLKLIFTCNPIEPIVAVATTERLNKLWKDRGELVFERPETDGVTRISRRIQAGVLPLEYSLKLRTIGTTALPEAAAR